MANGLMIALAALHLESDFLLAANMLDHFGFNGGIGDRRRAKGHFSILVDHEHAVKSERLAGFDRQALDLERVARADAILFASGFNNAVRHNENSPVEYGNRFLMQVRNGKKCK